MRQEKVSTPCAFHPDKEASTHIQAGPVMIGLCECCYRRVRGVVNLLGAINGNSKTARSP